MPSAPIPSFPWTGTTPGSAGPYSAAQFAAFIAGLYGRGVDVVDSSVAIYSNQGTAPTGLLQGFGFDVTAQGSPNMSVNVAPGTAVVNGTWAQNTATYIQAIAANVSGNPRIDTIVLHLDYTAQTVVVTILQGTPAGLPVPPGLTQSGLIWEVPLADIAVANAAASITQANITPRTVYANAPDGVYMIVKNNSGGTLVTGDVVVWDNTQQQTVKSSTTQGDQTVAGVMIGRTAATKAGMMLVKGVGWIHVNGAVSNGQALMQSTTANQAAPANLYTQPGAFAYAMSAVGGTGLMPAYIDASQVNQNALGWLLTNRAAPYVIRQGVADYTTTSATFVDVDAANLIVAPNTIFGTRVLVIATFIGLPPVGVDMYFDIFCIQTGARAGGTNGLDQSLSNNNNQSHTIHAIFSGLTPGVNQFKLQYRIASGGSPGTIRNNGQAITMFAIPI